jgi:branched-chain amino acid transport system permease protein
MYRVTRVFDFSYAATLAVSAYMAICVFGSMGLSAPVLLVCGTSVGVLLSALIELFIYRSLRRGGTPPIIFLLASLGLLTAEINLLSLVFGDAPQTLGGVVSARSFSVGFGLVTLVQIGAMGVSLFCGIICWWIWQKTKWGLVMRAVSDDASLAISVGLKGQKAILQATMLGSGLGAAAAVLAALDTGLTPSIGFNLLLPGVVAAILGGGGSIFGPMLGGILIGIIQQAGGWLFSTAWQDVVLYVLLIVFLLLRPQGIFGALSLEPRR